MHKVLGHNVAETISATFTEDTASKIGVSPRTIRRDVQERDIRGQISRKQSRNKKVKRTKTIP